MRAKQYILRPSWTSHIKNSELDPKFQKYKGRVVLQVQVDVVEDDSGSCAVFTEPGSAASLMTAAKLLKILKSECLDIWIRPPKHKWPKLHSSMEDPVVPLERNLYGHPLARLLRDRQFEKVLVEHGWEKVPNW